MVFYDVALTSHESWAKRLSAERRNASGLGKARLGGLVLLARRFERRRCAVRLASGPGAANLAAQLAGFIANRLEHLSLQLRCARNEHGMEARFQFRLERPRTTPSLERCEIRIAPGRRAKVGTGAHLAHEFSGFSFDHRYRTTMTTAQRPAWRRPRLRAPGAQGKSCVRATSKKTTCPPSSKGPVGACERHKTARARARSVATRACCAIVLAGHWPCWACASAGRGAGRRGTAGLGWGSSGVTAREARPPLARDIDRAYPKSRRWMCA